MKVMAYTQRLKGEKHGFVNLILILNKKIVIVSGVCQEGWIYKCPFFSCFNVIRMDENI
jgi:hypothetical protein